MKLVANIINEWGQEEIAIIERENEISINVEGEKVTLLLEDVEITSKDIPGWSVATEAGITVALDINIDEELRKEGIARDLVNRIQNLRKDQGLEVQDKIHVLVEQGDSLVDEAIIQNKAYICEETQALSLDLKTNVDNGTTFEIDELTIKLSISL
jgi:isoleucyl-tRNA synthetase